jgi:hypothetical protein
MKLHEHPQEWQTIDLVMNRRSRKQNANRTLAVRGINDNVTQDYLYT